jgi:hypothetical protein
MTIEVTCQPPELVAMTREQVEAGLADGTLERGVTKRWGKGRGDVPVPGQLQLPGQVDSVTPRVIGREVVGWIVLDDTITRALVAEVRWGAWVVAVGPRANRRPA